MSDAERIAALEQELAEARQTVQALMRGEIDAVAQDAGTSPTLLREAQEQLRSSEQLLRAVFDGSDLAKLICDDEGRYVRANAAACRLFGLQEHELLGRRIAEFAAPDYRPDVAWEQFLRDGTMHGEFPLVRPDGQRRELEFSAFANVLPGRHLSVLRDVTERNATERALRDTERRLRTVIANAPIILYALDVEGRYTLHEGKGVELIGLRPGQLVGQNVLDRMRDTPDAASGIQRALAGETVTGEYEASGRSFEAILIPLRDERGDISGVTGVAFDVTARKAAEAARRLGEARFRGMIENGADGICLIGRDGQILYASPAAARILRYPADALVGMDAFALFLDEDRTRVVAQTRGLIEDPSRPTFEEFQVRRGDGSLCWIESVGTNLLADPAVGALVANFRDISERKRAQDDLRASDLRYRRIVENTSEGVWLYDATGTTLFVNQRMATMLGVSVEEMIGLPIFAFMEEEGGTTARDHVTRRVQGIAERREFRLIRRDGTPLWVSIRVDELMDDAGRFESALALLTDITERKRAEQTLRQTEDQLRQSQKMEAVGSLAGGVAHDFNNLLTVILSYADMLLEELLPGDRMREDILEIRRAGARATELTRQLLAFGRKQILEPVVLDMNEVVAGVETMLRRLLGEDITLSVLRSPSPTKVHADPGQLVQVIMNLVVNARDAMPTGGNLTLEIADTTLDEQYAALHANVAPGPYVMLAVTDTGTGMDRETQARVFEPFFTTKDKSKGTGLGLSTAYGIIQQSGGHIWLYSEPGQGTTFKVYLPRTERPTESAVPQVEDPSMSVGVETILLVEDEQAVRTIMRAILRKAGYNVLEADNGGEAFLISEQFPATIHMLLTDVVMPRMSGRQLAERLLQQRPGMRVLFVSGYNEDTIVHHGVLDAGIEFLTKPVTPDALLRKVRQVLDGRTRRSSSSPHRL